MVGVQDECSAAPPIRMIASVLRRIREHLNSLWYGLFINLRQNKLPESSTQDSHRH